jgi:SpoVK/Ycf46/Vps4 family AAA+-type ATPase
MASISRTTVVNRNAIQLSPELSVQQLTTKLDWPDLALPEATLLHIHDIRAWLSMQPVRTKETKAYERPAPGKRKPGYRALFNGTSATNKALTAALLGKQVKQPVLRIDLSTVVSKHVDKTEKNLALIFEKAHQHTCALYFDEADALFGKRTSVHDSHDRYASQEVTYFLHKMEKFDGLVILAGNDNTNVTETLLSHLNAVITFTESDATKK